MTGCESRKVRLWLGLISISDQIANYSIPPFGAEFGFTVCTGQTAYVTPSQSAVKQAC